MAITATMVRELREMTGAAMMDCKKALDATAGDMDAAVDHLRKAGLKTAAKKAGRETSEGRVAVALGADGRSGSIVAVRCETDFVANTPDFEQMMEDFTATAMGVDLPAGEAAAEAFTAAKMSDGQTVAERLSQVIGKLGENMGIGGAAHFENAGGCVGGYVHHNNTIGALASVTTTADAAKASALTKQLCQHISVFKPTYLNREAVPAESIERERAVIAESDDVKKKPAEFQEKIVTGKLERFFAENCLLEQGWMLDDKQKVAKVLEAELGSGSTVAGFAMFTVKDN